MKLQEAEKWGKRKIKIFTFGNNGMSTLLNIRITPRPLGARALGLHRNDQRLLVKFFSLVFFLFVF